MKTKNYHKTTGLWLGTALLAAAVIAGCAGHNGFFTPEPESKDSLEHVTSATFDERVLKSDKPVLVDFYAEWCNPCRELTPLLEEFASEHPEVRVVKVNVDDNRELAQRYNAMTIPLLLVIRDGKVVKTSVGKVPKSALVKLVASEASNERG
jgi:thioredoxin 1